MSSEELSIGNVGMLLVLEVTARKARERPGTAHRSLGNRSYEGRGRLRPEVDLGPS
jgi:hypothetical protein